MSKGVIGDWLQIMNNYIKDAGAACACVRGDVFVHRSLSTCRILAGAEVCVHSCVSLPQCVCVCMCLDVGGLMCAGYVLNEGKPAGAV